MEFERAEVATLKHFAERLKTRSHPLFIELVSDPGAGRTTVMRMLHKHLTAMGWASLWTDAYPGRLSSRRSLVEVAERMSANLSKPSREAIELAVEESITRTRKLSAAVAEAPLTQPIPNLIGALRERFRSGPAVFFLDGGEHADVFLMRLLFKLLASSTLYVNAGPRMFVASTSGGMDLPLGYPGDLLVRPMRLETLSEDTLATFLESQGCPASTATLAASTLTAKGIKSLRTAALLAEELRLNPPGNRAAVEDLLDRDQRALYLRRRLAPLSEDELTYLKITAVSLTGVNFWRFHRFGEFSRREVERLTTSLEGKGLLGRAYPGGRLRFIIPTEAERQVLSKLVPDKLRRLYHGRLARLLRRDDLDPHELSSEMGQHLLLSGDDEGGRAKLLWAGRDMLERGRVDESRRHYEEVARRTVGEKALVLDAHHAAEGLADVEAYTLSFEEAARRYQAILEDGKDVLTAKDRVRLLEKRARTLCEGGKLNMSQKLLAVAQKACGKEMHVEKALLLDLAARLSILRGDMTSAETASQRALAIAKKLRNERFLARIHTTVGAVRHARGELRESLVDFAAARDLLEKLGLAPGFAKVCLYEGDVFAALGQLQDAILKFRSALHISEEVSDPIGETNALNRLAELHVLADELDLAEESFRGSLRIQRRMGDMHGAASSLVNLGAIARERGKYHQALQLANEAALIAEQAQDLGLKLTAQDAMVPGLTSLGRLGEALTLVKDVQSQSRAIGTNRVLASALLSASDCLLLIGDLEAAREKSLNALQMSREHGFAQLEWRALRLLCETEIERENYVQARKYLVTARTLQMSHEPRQKRDLDLLELRVTACEAGSAGLSKKEVKSLLRLAALGTPPFRIRVAQLLAQSLPPEEALLWIQLAYNQSKQLGHKDGIWRSAFRLSEVERALGKPDAASHRDEAIRTILSVAAFLGESLKEVYLDSFGRREILKSARVQKTG